MAPSRWSLPGWAAGNAACGGQLQQVRLGGWVAPWWPGLGLWSAAVQSLQVEAVMAGWPHCVTPCRALKLCNAYPMILTEGRIGVWKDPSVAM
ncbi:hypothetical protein NDU88_005204 [Pleurodeles waltl]|uniref:Uncharacterized protein n=1 Tax=Pleurodeles waltl TaxID=8319 RepID=A0AAV7MIP4_PLEWA|nr:hypothetical protein NDU88_005204 [Pleurodeles waltl]